MVSAHVSARKLSDLARAKGIKVGLVQANHPVPFPGESRSLNMAKQVKGILAVEMSAGQMIEDVKLVSGRKCRES